MHLYRGICAQDTSQQAPSPIADPAVVKLNMVSHLLCKCILNLCKRLILQQRCTPSVLHACFFWQ